MKLTEREILSLQQALRAIPDPRKPRGVRFVKQSLLLISVAAVLSGARSLEAIAQWARECTQTELARLLCRRSLRTQRREAPSEPTLRRFLQTVNTEAVDAQLSGWLASLQRGAEDAVAIDGKCLRGACGRDGKRVHLLSAVVHSSGITIAQRQVGDKTNEIPEAPKLLAPLELAGRCVTGDALHTQVGLARFLVEEKRADYCFTVKDNQRTLNEDISRLFEQAAPPPSVRDSREGARADRDSSDLDVDGSQRLRGVSPLRAGSTDRTDHAERQDRKDAPRAGERNHEPWSG